MRIKSDKLVICALFAAIMVVSSQIIIPIGVVPLSLASLAVMICGGVLGIKYGMISTLLYIFMGAVGIPVFSGFKGGIGALLGPSGGFIIGYLFIALLSGFAYGKKNKTVYRLLVSGISVVVCYALGTAWYMYATKSEFPTAFFTCVLPFLPGDAIKIAVSNPLILRIKKQI